MKIAVRLDDVTPDMDWPRFYAFKELLDRHGIRPLLGVVPENRDETIRGSQKGAPEDFWDYLKALEAEGASIALHGYRHQYTTDKGGLFPLNRFSEFAGLPYEKQLAMLQEGKAVLESHGILTDIFMAPAHSYDKNTIRALKETGFTKITDGFGSCPYQWNGIIFYPISFHLGRTLQEKEGYSTMVVHAGTVKEEELNRYEEYFQNPEAEWISYAEYLQVTPIRQKAPGRVKEYVMAAGKSLAVKLRQR